MMSNGPTMGPYSAALSYYALGLCPIPLRAGKQETFGSMEAV